MADLHFIRMRQKDDNTFYDPMADLRYIVVRALPDVMFMLNDTFNGTDLEADKNYVTGCLSVFLIRLREDKAPLDKQWSDFIYAIHQANDAVLFATFRFFTMYIFAVFGLYMRRDARVDAGRTDEANRSSALMLLASSLQAGGITIDSMLKAAHLPMDPVLFSERLATDNAAAAVCKENPGKSIEGIKEKACKFMQMTGGEGWNDLSEACDKAFSGANDTTTAISLSLAYPSYKAPYTEVVDIEGVE